MYTTHRSSARACEEDLDANIIHDALTRGSQVSLDRVHRHYGAIIRCGVVRAARMSRWSEDVDELLQDVWCRLLRNNRRVLRYFDPSRGRFGRYVYWVAYQQARGSIGQRHRQRTLGRLLPNDAIPDTRASFTARLDQRDYIDKLLRTAGLSLTTNDGILLRAHYIEGRAFRELGETLGVADDALYKRNQRLKAKLHRARAMLAAQGSGE